MHTSNTALNIVPILTCLNLTVIIKGRYYYSHYYYYHHPHFVDEKQYGTKR